MTQEEITNLIIQTLTRILELPVGQITATTDVAGMDLDSLDIAEIAATLRERGVTFDKKRGNQAETVADLTAFAAVASDKASTG